MNECPAFGGSADWSSKITIIEINTTTLERTLKVREKKIKTSIYQASFINKKIIKTNEFFIKSKRTFDNDQKQLSLK